MTKCIQCTKCKKSLDLEKFKDDKKSKIYKTCLKCRIKHRKFENKYTIN